MHATRRSFLTGALAAAAGASSHSVLAQGPEKSPASAMAADPRPTIAAPDDDPYLWLEEIDGARALAWVEARNSATLARFGNARFAADRDVLTAILDRPDRVPGVTRHGRHLYNLWRDAANPRGLWRRTTLASYRSEQPAWETILDVDRLAATQGEDWVWKGASILPGTHDRAILRLSRSGSDAVVLREFDMATKAFVADGFTLPEAKGGTAWLDGDTLLSSAFGSGMATASGYARTVRLWRRGASPQSAPVLLETARASMSAGAAVDRTQATETVWFYEKPTFFDTVVRMGDRTGPTVKLDLPADAGVGAHQGWLAVRPRTAWQVGAAPHAPDTVLGMSLARFLAGERDFSVLFEPAERRALQHFFWCAGRLVLSILDELQPVFEVLTPSAGAWTRATLPGLPRIGVASVWPLDADASESNGDLLADVQERPTSTSPPPAATATARTTGRSRRSRRSATPS